MKNLPYIFDYLFKKKKNKKKGVEEKKKNKNKNKYFFFDSVFKKFSTLIFNYKFGLF